jgi:hypothetical protein
VKASFCFPAGRSLLSFGARSCSGGARSSESCWPGVARRQVTFFCFAKRKSPKKRRPAVWVPCATLRGNLRCSSQAGSKTTRFAQTSFCPDPLVSALLGPARTGQSGAGAGTNTNKDTPWRVLVSSGIRYSFSTPCGCAEERRSRRIRAKTCLSRRRVVFDPVWAEHRRLPRSERSEAQGTQEPGSPFLLLTFLLAKQKKSELPPGNPRPAALSKEHRRSALAGARAGQVGGGTTP